MTRVAFELNLATDDVTESDFDPQCIYVNACWHIQYDDGAVRVYGHDAGEIHLLGKGAVNDDDVMFAVAGPLPWERVAKALSTILSSAELVRDIRLLADTRVSELTAETTRSEPFFTFDFDTTTGVVTNVARRREEHLRECSSTRWQVVVTTSTVMVYAHDGSRITLIGRSRRETDSSFFTSTTLSPVLDSVGWRGIASAVVTASSTAPAVHSTPGARVPVRAPAIAAPSTPVSAPQAIAEAPVDKYPNTTIVYPRPRRRLSTRHFVVGSLGVFYFLLLVYLLVRASTVVGDYPLSGAHAVFVPLFVLAAPIALAIGLLLASHPHALADNQRRRETGRVHPGPRTSAGMGIAFVGTLVGVYPIMILNHSSLDRRPPSIVGPTTTTPTNTMPTNTQPTTTTPTTTTPTNTTTLSPLTLAESIARVKPTLGDGANNAGAWELARYASTHLAWRDVAITDVETTIPLVLKDSDLERGKRLCATGTLTEIERTDLEKRPVFTGTLRTADGDDVRFIAVGSTGSLVKRSSGTLCGVVTGRADKAVMLVGMFDLPENAMPAVER